MSESLPIENKKPAMAYFIIEWPDSRYEAFHALTTEQKATLVSMFIEFHRVVPESLLQHKHIERNLMFAVEKSQDRLGLTPNNNIDTSEFWNRDGTLSHDNQRLIYNDLIERFYGSPERIRSAPTPAFI